MEYDRRETKYAKKYVKQLMNKLSSNPKLNFFENKLAPATSLVKEMLRGETFNGEPVSVTSAGISLFVPISVENIWESTEIEDRANLLLIMIADGLGISTNTYEKKKKKGLSKGKL